MTSLTRCVGVIGAIWVVGVARPAISADYRRGVLTIRVPRVAAALPRKVPVVGGA